MDQINLGAQISCYRKACGLTQESLANQLGISNQAVSKWESDQCCPDIQLLPKLAEIFNISIDQLFGREIPAPPVIHELPWEDDNQFRAVLYQGRKLQRNKLFNRHSAEKAQIEFHYSGPAVNVNSDFSVTCTNCTIEGSITAGDGVVCQDVFGSVSAGDGIECRDIYGSATAGDSIRCGTIGGNVTAGDSIHCTEIGGKAEAGDRIIYTK